MKRNWVLSLLIGICVSLGALAQEAKQGAEGKQGAKDEKKSAATEAPGSIRLSLDYRIGPGDEIEIQVVNAADLNQKFRVTPSGDITVQPAGTMRASGLTASELEEQIGKFLAEKKLLQSPQVLVFVRDYHAKRIFVSGEFVNQGEFVMSQQLSVMDAVLLAGGVGPFAERYAYLHRRSFGGRAATPPPAAALESPAAPREGTQIIKVDLQPMLEGGAPSPDLPLEEGDALILARRQIEYFYVLGDVHAPLNYPYPYGKTLTVSQAIAGAGGPTRTAKMSKGILVRTDQNGNRKEVPVDFSLVLRGKQPDFPILPNDVVFIPGSTMRTIGEGYIDASNAMIAGTLFKIGRSYQLPDNTNNSNRQ